MKEKAEFIVYNVDFLEQQKVVGVERLILKLVYIYELFLTVSNADCWNPHIP